MKKLIFALALLLGCGGLVTQSAIANPKDKPHHYTKVQKNTKAKTTARVKQEINNEAVSIVYNEDTTAGYWNAERARNEKQKNSVNTTKVTKASVVKTDNNLIHKASRYMGATAKDLGLPRNLWCADFMNMILGGSDRRAISYVNRGSKAHYGCVNCVAVTTRKGGAHVGIVSGYDENGDPIIISGNHNKRVGVATYNRQRVIAYRNI